jgi:hypothetical protein
MKKVFIALLGTAMMFAGGGGCKQSESTPDADPALTGTVSISGEAKVGETLEADITQLVGDGTPDYHYKWLRGEEVISDATGATYTLGTNDIADSVITVEVTRTGYTGVVKSSNSYKVE